jgi:phosphoketolase
VVLPILHLNGYKIANPCVLARISHEELDHLFRGYGYTPYFVEGDEPEKMHELMAATLAVRASSPCPSAATRSFRRRKLQARIDSKTAASLFKPGPLE